jgi:hypothetical protein
MLVIFGVRLYGIKDPILLIKFLFSDGTGSPKSGIFMPKGVNMLALER